MHIYVKSFFVSVALFTIAALSSADVSLGSTSLLNQGYAFGYLGGYLDDLQFNLTASKPIDLPMDVLSAGAGFSAETSSDSQVKISKSTATELDFSGNAMGSLKLDSVGPQASGYYDASFTQWFTLTSPGKLTYNVSLGATDIAYLDAPLTSQGLSGFGVIALAPGTYGIAGESSQSYMDNSGVITVSGAANGTFEVNAVPGPTAAVPFVFGALVGRRRRK